MSRAVPILKQCREAFGPPPRRFSLWQWHTYLKAKKPPWLPQYPDDRLHELYRDQRKLFTTGRVVWANIVQANQLLFAPGPDDSPAEAVYSFDPGLESDAAIHILKDLGHRLFALKGTTPPGPRLAEFARAITDERERTPRREIPPDLTRGLRVYHTTVMGVRKHLPGGYLAESFFPLVASPDLMWTMILPSRYWPKELLELWEG
jgi:hypothetical protein